MPFYCYILFSPTRNKYYVGCCEDLNARLKKYNTNHDGFTGKTGNWKLVYKESFPAKKPAMQRESEIKKMEE